ncbi:MAG: hypothetical protein JNG88_14050 [Phycisphaerales bacterium]|nr:hypothetical protein [Phycisphaerales bacterium]
MPLISRHTTTSLLVVFALSAAVVSATPPRVVRATPDHTEIMVDPATKEIRIEFDQDMSPGGHSICGGGPAFPKLNGKPTWENPRIMVIPVQLEAGHEYSFSINCPAAQNFRSAAGEPAVVYPITFRTAKPGEKPPVPPTPEENKKAAENLRKAIDEQYSYKELRKVDWARRFTEHQQKLETAASASGFARAAADLLSAANDPHISIRVNGFTLGTYRGKSAQPNFNGRLLSTLITDLQDPNECVLTGTVSDIPYLLISTWGPADAAMLEPAFDFIREHADAPAMIVDVRVNGGGDETLAQQVAGCFVDKPGVYSKNCYRDAKSPSGFGKTFDRTISPNKDRAAFKGRVAVLMGPTNMSSNESFLLMMRVSPRCKLIGERSFGSSGNPKPHELGNGVTVLLPSWKDMLPDGKVLEGKGVEPDIKVAAKPEDFAKSDPVLEAAVKELRNK